MSQNLPVIVIGAGPVGLATAAHLRERNQEVLILESGDSAGSAISQWSHIKLFSPWRFNIDAAARRLLETATEGYGGCPYLFRKWFHRIYSRNFNHEMQALNNNPSPPL